jgi:hypothetical protein
VAIAVDASASVVVAAEVVGRPSATFLRLAASVADVLPLVVPGQGVWVTVFAGSGSGR